MPIPPTHPNASADAPAITAPAAPAGHYIGGVFQPPPPLPPCVRALEIAVVQLCRQTQADPDYKPNDDPVPQDPSAYRLYLATRMANFLGAWRACTFPACAQQALRRHAAALLRASAGAVGGRGRLCEGGDAQGAGGAGRQPVKAGAQESKMQKPKRNAGCKPESFRCARNRRSASVRRRSLTH